MRPTVLRHATLALVLGLASCAEDAQLEVPTWAHVAPEQIAEAKKHGVPVAFENDLGMRFVLIPAGTFLMGSPEGETDRGDDESQHPVTLTRPYYVQVTEVTNAEYRRWQASHDSKHFQGHAMNGELQPAVRRVTWHAATEFAQWLSKDDGRGYRLPTEAEWERAARAGTTGRFWWGESEEDAHRYANTLDPLTQAEFGPPGAAFPRDDGHRVAAPVGSYLPNAWGLYDMLGNAWEWCQDSYGKYGQGPVVDPTGAETPAARVLRGGSWSYPPQFVRCATRRRDGTATRDIDRGFRLVSPLPETGAAHGG